MIARTETRGDLPGQKHEEIMLQKSGRPRLIEKKTLPSWQNGEEILEKGNVLKHKNLYRFLIEAMRKHNPHLLLVVCF